MTARHRPEAAPLFAGRLDELADALAARAAGGRPVLLAGPTASGKSALALALAERLGGEVVNADALQVYDCWRVLTARPSPEEEARAPHHLYGIVPPERRDWSVGSWLAALAPILERARRARRSLIVVGGTGLYFTALTEGLAPIPPVPAELRARLEARLAAEGREALARELARRDPATAARIDRANPARVLRALEVLEATGRGLAAWQAEAAPPLLPAGAAVTAVLWPERAWLHARIARRLDAMLAGGALDEVRAARRWWDPRLPAARAIGAAELMAHVEGRIDLETARERVLVATRRYAKRQFTWARGRLGHWPRLALIAD
ncbi:MAG: tRNA (adenosine(37)-N6)-dimethylallyltransferase MiaA [Alphaproteobacteria bacterium]|nr:MAG: tRNA (adenosine(37)-N6)-dimethylallyltransferase MiaA [Alphaproteobacteria bacterium]